MCDSSQGLAALVKICFVCFFLSGETGIGKSTLINTLFNTNFEELESSHFCPCVRLRAQTYQLQESNVHLKLTIVNTVGFGDQINKEERYVGFLFVSFLVLRQVLF